ncbi:unnamed protein product [Vitrella brassicaformis CCMP3155]|uniref:Amino acid permease/ SLC12A domain-containing protein n=1 Tax=Vitrella brassicaformis (strain CCMP3155) TaxID=1169540 RepID=A0A0G4F9A3_VITBC|nr:unnamed protein product [Vitrella brassicaformis CCMP3155]|eukprot:CEM08836.1 unnamed protein product [Vitrella brassicaformis CCMP3155]
MTTTTNNFPQTSASVNPSELGDLDYRSHVQSNQARQVPLPDHHQQAADPEKGLDVYRHHSMPAERLIQVHRDMAPPRQRLGMDPLPEGPSEVDSFGTPLSTRKKDAVWRGDRGSVIGLAAKHHEKMQTEGGPKQGVVMGVIFPCMANILGVLLFLRLPWIVGKAGILFSLLIVFICCSCTFITALSLSAVATNGKIRAGGSYFLISRSLGPPIGAAVGLCFYLGNSVGASMYLIGTVEAWEVVQPDSQIFPATEAGRDLNNVRVTGLICLALCVFAVAVGLKWVARAGTVFLMVVLMVIGFMYLGCFVGPTDLTPTTVDLAAVPADFITTTPNTTYKTTPLQGEVFIEDNTTSVVTFSNGISVTTIENGTVTTTIVDLGDGSPNVNNTILTEPVTIVTEAEAEGVVINRKAQTVRLKTDGGFVGIDTGVFADNLWPDYDIRQFAIIPKPETDWKGDDGKIVDSRAFIWLLSLWFPACTGIMAGSNRSADLRTPGKDIPFGTLFAQILTSVIYLSFCLINGAVATRFVLVNDKFFASTSALVPEMVSYGVMASTIGAALQSLISAPRLLSAIASDGTVPFLRRFAVRPGQEPRLALALSTVICAGCICSGDLNFVAPIITIFFLMCYLFVNLACFLLSVLKMPSWRPGFRFYHWSVAMIGMLLCLALMIMISWYACLAAFIFALILFRYVSYHSQQLNWGDGVRGVKFEWARNFLTDLDPYQHTKVLALVGLTPNPDGSQGLVLNDTELVHFVSQLKEGRGLTILGGIVDEDPTKLKFNTLRNWNHTVSKSLRDIDIMGFAKILYSGKRLEALSHIIQLSGLGGFEPNCIVASWPIDWAVNTDARVALIKTIHLCTCLDKSVALLKTNNTATFPLNNQIMNGTIDIWWVVTDGGLLLLMPFLLQKHRVWHSCKLRLFAVVERGQDKPEVHEELEEYIKDHRLPIELQIFPMDGVFHTVTDLRYRIAKRRTLIPHVGLPEKLPPTHPLAAGSRFLRQPTFQLMSGTDLLTHKLQMERLKDIDTVPHSDSTPLFPVTSPPSPAPKRAAIPAKPQPQQQPQPQIRRGASGGNVGSSQTPKHATLDNSSPKSGGSGQKSPRRLSDPLIEEGRGPQFFPVSFAMKREELESVSQAHEAVLDAAKALNAAFRSRSLSADLVVTNLPDVPQDHSAFGYMQFVEVLCADLKRVVLIRGSATEVITAFT